MESQGSQSVRSAVSDCQVQSEAGFSRLPQGMCGTRKARQRRLLASQVSVNLCDSMPLGGSGSKDSAAVARALRHGIHNAVSETIAEQL
jgi:hypothetical protein